MTASGCGAVVKEYGHLLRHDPRYAEKAAKISAMTRDISEVMAAEFERLEPLAREEGRAHRVSPAVHAAARAGAERRDRESPRARRVRADAGARLASVLRLGRNLLDPRARASERLRANKLAALASGEPEQIVTGQHRLPGAPAGRHRAAGEALDRAASRSGS